MIVRIIVSLICFVLAYFMIVKKKVNLLHSYHLKNVKEEDKDALAVYSGIGTAIVGLGVLLGNTEIIFVGIAIGVVFIFKYNGGLF